MLILLNIRVLIPLSRIPAALKFCRKNAVLILLTLNLRYLVKVFKSEIKSLASLISLSLLVVALIIHIVLNLDLIICLLENDSTNLDLILLNLPATLIRGEDKKDNTPGKILCNPAIVCTKIGTKKGTKQG